MTELKITARVDGNAAAELDKIDASAKRLGDSTSKLSEGFKELNAAGGAAALSLAAGVAAFTAAAVAGEGQAMALERLGPAYQEVQRQTAGTVTAQEALRAQQQLLQSGLSVTNTQLGTITRAAREYARATGTDTTQAIEQLSQALVNGEAGGLRRFGIAVEQGATRAHTFERAMRQLTAAQQESAPAARTLAEETDAFARSFTDAGSALALFGARAIGLDSILAGVSSRLQSVARDAQELNQLNADMAGQRQRNAAAAAAQQRHVAALRAARGSLEAAGLGAQGLGAAADISGLSAEQVDRVSASLEALSRRLPNTQLSAADIARRQGDVAAPRPYDTSFAALEDIARERQSGAAAYAAARRNAPGAISQIGAEIERMRRENAAPPPGAAPGAPTAAGGTAPDYTAAGAARIREIEQVAKARIAAEIELRTQIEETGRAEKNRAVERSQAADALIDSERRERAGVIELATERQSAENALATAEGRGSEVARERVAQLNDVRAALQAMIAETSARIAQAEDEHRSQQEINELVRERVGLTRSLSQTTSELAQIQRENSQATRDFADAMGNAGVGAASAFTDALWTANDANQSLGASVQNALREQLKALSKEAVPNVLKNLALAASAAFTNPAAAPGFLAAAGLWGAVGVAAGAGAAAIPAAPQKPAATGGGAASARAASVPNETGGGGPLTLQINVSGAMFNEGVQESVVRALDSAHARGVTPRFARS